MEVQQASGTRILELDTVRALHQTVVSLRAALEASKTELHHLRHKYETHTDQSLYTDALQKLASENQLLREKITSSQEFKIEDNHAVKQTVNDPLAESVKKVKFNLNTEPFRERLEDTINVEQNVDGSEESDSICESPQVTKQETEVLFKVQTEPPKLDVETTPDTLDVFLSEGIVIKNSDNVTIVTENNFEKITKESEQFKEVFIKHSEENIENELDGAFETRIELESRFDLTIKVSASKTGEFQPIRVETSDDSFITFSKDNNQFRNNSNSRHKFDEDTKITVTSSENVNIINDTLHIVEEQTTIVSEDHFEMAGSRDADSVNPISDKFNVQVKIISEEDLVTDSSPKRVCNSDHLTTETDDLSIRSISEGDNSVFSENVGGGGGGGGGGMGSGGRRVCEQDSISGNDSEEVDDIELIFTNDDTKELTGFQEDLVSITEGDAWTGGRSDASTPVLLRFNVLDPEGQMQDRSGNTASTDNFENENQENFIHQGVMADSDMHTRKGILRKGNGNDLNENAGEIFDDVDDLPQGRRPYLRSSSTKNYLEAQESRHQNRKSFESNESCSFDNQKSYSFDHTPQNSSFERGSSMDAETRELSFDQRDESLDQFDVSKSTMRTQYSVYVETDISKCGVMEDDGFSGNLNVRRNTCPNPFQYRPLPHREVVRGAIGSGGAAGGVHPLLALPGPRAPRRSSAAQTHISALPGHWRSDTQLARKILPPALTTLPAKVHMESFPSRLVSSGAAQTTRRSEESRRVLLSDIGFTSMVPELSRSAEPVWAGLQPLPPGPPPRPLCCAQHAAQCFGSVPSSPTRTDSQSTNSRYWSKGSMQRSVSGRMGDTIIPGSNRVGFYAEQPLKWRGSLPELRAPTCPHGGHGGHGARLAYRLPRAGDSEDSTEELLDEAERFLRSSIDCLSIGRAPDDEFCPSNYSRPYLPSGPRQLRLGHLVKVIAPHGKIALGKVRYVGVAGGPTGPGGATPTYVGLQLGPGASGGGDGSFRGRRYFHCEKGRSVFVPFSKVVMAWADC